MGKNSHKSFFIPLFCGSSRKDVVKHTPLPNSSFREPSSPKLSLTGKIKKKSPTTTTHDDNSNNNSSSNNNENDNNPVTTSSTHEKSFGLSKRYTNLHNLFSIKNLVTTPIDATCINKPLGHSNRYTKHHNTLVHDKTTLAIETTSIENSNTKFVMKRSKSHSERRIKPVRVEVTRELDPLPVVKCSRRDHEMNVNLLKRRGIEMKTLQIQPIQVIMDQQTHSL